ncbi:MAG: DUF5947 family protein [Candidatus Sulfotelmatobacter sp.]
MIKTEPGRETLEAFDALRQFVRKPRRNVEQCELCSTDLHAHHPHLIELTQRKLLCSCDACALLFSGRTDAKYKRVPRDVRLLADFHMTDGEWDSLLIPINLAFFFQNSLTARVGALYPSPAGATESLLPLEAWNHIVEYNPVLRLMEPDVEALLVNRVGHARHGVAAEYYIVPIDQCYKLVGLIRLHWHGLSGGTEIWQKVGEFFNQLRTQADVVSKEMHA